MHSHGFLLFVYGTLKRGDVRCRHLAGQRFVDFATTAPSYALFDCGEYPALVAAPIGGVSIRGELWRVDAAALARLDVVEGSDEGWFVRGPVTLDPPFNDRTVQAYHYARSVVGLPRMKGEWKPKQSP